MKINKLLFCLLISAGCAAPAWGDENLLGYTKGAETLPKGAKELDVWVTQRSGKGQGEYTAWDTRFEFEYGLTNNLTGSLYLKGMALDTSGLIIDGYLPEENQFNWRASGVEAALMQMHISPALNGFGLATYYALSYDWIDPHSGQDKNKYTLELKLLTQNFFADDQLVWLNNFIFEGTYADRDAIPDLPSDIEWPTEPEMEIGLSYRTGLSYRIAPKWFIGAEIVYDTEFETEVGQERWTVQAGPSVHYAQQKWWMTVTWLPQLRGGGETYEGQTDTNLHLIEKTETEVRLKVGINF